MPYNNTPIAPPKDFTGSVSLPLARVKKIIHVDDDISNCSNNAAFVITVATEMFIQHLVERTHEVIKSEKRPRRNIQYGDLANAVARTESLEFLTDVVPRTTTYRKVQVARERRETEKVSKPKQHSGQSSGRMPINGSFQSNGMTEGGSSKPLEAEIVDDDVDIDAMVVDERPRSRGMHDPVREQLEMEMADRSVVNGAR